MGFEQCRIELQAHGPGFGAAAFEVFGGELGENDIAGFGFDLEKIPLHCNDDVGAEWLAELQFGRFPILIIDFDQLLNLGQPNIILGFAFQFENHFGGHGQLRAWFGQLDGGD